MLKKLLAVLAVLAAFAVCCAAAEQTKTPAPVTYVIANEDGTLHNYITFYAASGTDDAPALYYNNDAGTHGTGIAGGYFGASRVTFLPDPSTNCAYGADANSGDIAAVDISSESLVGTFPGSENDDGTANGMSLAVSPNYLYAGYSTSNTIATFAVMSGCQLSFLGDITVAPLNGGSVSALAIHGNMMIATYADGSIESFNIANGIPIPNNDEQNSTGFASAFFPLGIDITQDGHFAIFGDSSVPTTVEVADISSGKLHGTRQYTVGGGHTALGFGLNSGTVRLSPDETLLYIANSQGNTITAALFNKNTGQVAPGCTSTPLLGYFNPWGYIGQIATRDATGNGGVLYAAEWGNPSSIAILKIQSSGSTCSLVESSASPYVDYLSTGLLSIQTFPPRPF